MMKLFTARYVAQKSAEKLRQLLSMLTTTKALKQKSRTLKLLPVPKTVTPVTSATSAAVLLRLPVQQLISSITQPALLLKKTELTLPA